MPLKQRLARWIPKQFRYFVIINTAAEYSGANPTQIVPEITWDQMAKYLEEDK